MTRRILALAVVFLLIGAWSLVVPVGEAPDEQAHWKFVSFVHANHRLPTLQDRLDQWIQMPLYYLLAAPLAVDPDFPWRATIDPPGAASYGINPPQFFYHEDDDFRKYWPVRFTRLLTGLTALIGVVFCYLAAFEATACRHTAFLAAGLMAVLPEFTFRAGTVSNDMAAASLSAVSVYYCVRLLKRGANWPDALSGAAVMGLAFVTKMHTIFLPMAWLVALYFTGSWRSRLKWTAALGIWIVLAAGPLIRNYALYRDPFLIRTEAGSMEPDRVEHALLSPYFLHQFPRAMADSFVGAFGHMNVWAPGWVYLIYQYLLLASILGGLWLAVARKLDWRLAILLLAVIGGNAAVVVTANMTFQQPQGRYMFPALSAICILCAIGLRALPLFRAPAVYALLAVLLAVNIDILRRVIFPIYWESPAVAQNARDGTLGPLSGRATVEQTFLSPCASLNRIDVQIGTYYRRQPGWVVLTVADTAQRSEEARQSVLAYRIRDNAFVKFQVGPVENALGRQLQIRVQGTAPTGEGVAVWRSSAGTVAGGDVTWNGGPQPGAITFRAYCSNQWGWARVKALWRGAVAGR